MGKTRIEIDEKYLNPLEGFGVPYIIIKDNSVKSDWIYVSSLDFEVSRKRLLCGKDFYETDKILHAENQKKLTMPEFGKYLQFTREDEPEVFEEITAVRSPWRATWLDADFKVEGREFVVYYYIFEEGKVVKKRKKLARNTLEENRTPGISLENWIKNPTKQGLPKNSIESGNLYYWSPGKDNNSVARFNAGSGRAYLGCNGDPQGSDADLGVFVAKLRE